MKRILIATLAIVLFAGAAQAQTKDTARHHQKHLQHKGGGHDMMAKQLNLTADQQAKLKSIREQEHKEMKALKNSSSTKELKEQRAVSTLLGHGWYMVQRKIITGSPNKFFMILR